MNETTEKIVLVGGQEFHFPADLDNAAIFASIRSIRSELSPQATMEQVGENRFEIRQVAQSKGLWGAAEPMAPTQVTPVTLAPIHPNHIRVWYNGADRTFPAGLSPENVLATMRQLFPEISQAASITRMTTGDFVVTQSAQSKGA